MSHIGIAIVSDAIRSSSKGIALLSEGIEMFIIAISYEYEDINMFFYAMQMVSKGMHIASNHMHIELRKS